VNANDKPFECNYESRFNHVRFAPSDQSKSVFLIELTGASKQDKMMSMPELAQRNEISFDLVTRIKLGWEGLCPFPFPVVPTSLKNAEPRYFVKKSELDILASEITRIKANAAETHMLAYSWMEAHDKLRAGKTYTFPKPTDLPEALAEIARLRSIIAKMDGALANWPTAVPVDITASTN
jgi:hypothetical protein